MLGWSLRRHCGPRPLVCLVTTQVGAHARVRLAKRFDRTVEVEPIANPNADVHVEGWVNSGYTKLHVFGLTDYDKVVYIDADCLVRANVDHVRARAPSRALCVMCEPHLNRTAVRPPAPRSGAGRVPARPVQRRRPRGGPERRNVRAPASALRGPGILRRRRHRVPERRVSRRACLSCGHARAALTAQRRRSGTPCRPSTGSPLRATRSARCTGSRRARPGATGTRSAPCRSVACRPPAASTAVQRLTCAFLSRFRPSAFFVQPQAVGSRRQARRAGAAVVGELPRDAGLWLGK